MPWLQPQMTRYGTGDDIYALAGATGGTGFAGPTGAIGSTGVGLTGSAGASASTTPQSPSIVLGAAPGVVTSGANGVLATIPALSGISVTAGQRYSVSLYTVLSGTQSYTGTQYAQTVLTFNNTADTIIINSVISIGSAIGEATTIEFRVPATNTQLNVGVQGLGITGGNTVSAAVFSFYITPLGV